jgi:hypothetical protein
MICTTGASRGKPSHVAARYSKADQMLDQVEVMRLAAIRTIVAGWEREWIADGTLQPNWLYQPVNERGDHIGAPTDFVTAMTAIWSANVWRNEPPEGSRVDPVGPATGAAATEAAGI